MARSEFKSGVVGYCAAGRGSAQSIGNGGGLVVIDLVDSIVDPDGMITTGAGWNARIPAGKGGVWLVTGRVAYGTDAINTLTNAEAWLYKNGVPWIQGFRTSVGPNAYTTFAVDVAERLAALDQISLRTGHTSASGARSLYGDVRNTFLRLARISD